MTDDLNLIEQSLKAWRRYAYSHRYGGLGAELEKVSQALVAFERIRTWIECPQLTLPLQGDKDAESLSI